LSIGLVRICTRRLFNRMSLHCSFYIQFSRRRSLGRGNRGHSWNWCGVFGFRLFRFGVSHGLFLRATFRQVYVLLITLCLNRLFRGCLRDGLLLFSFGLLLLLSHVLICSFICSSANSGRLYRVGVSGCGFTNVLAVGVISDVCFVFFAFDGVEARMGVTGTTGITGTTGVIFDDVVRDIGRDPGRDFASATTVRGMAGAEKPGGIVGVARRVCAKK
jgi:hypothetical protein